jgi:acyl-CoA synthetase (AMP-forming)/AMP-acid ligase II
MANQQFNLADLFELVTDKVPDRIALVAGDRRLTYAELDARANRFGHALLDQGIEPGQWIGIHAYNRAEWIEAFIGCLKARLVPININYRYVTDELRYVFDNADLAALVYEAEFGPRVEAVVAELPKLQTLIRLHDVTNTTDGLTSLDYETALASATPDRDFEPRSPDDLYVLYTGGTTGMPKGVMWRAEDIFFAALGGGNYGGPAISEPHDIQESIGDHQMCSMAFAPLMHGNAQWTSLVTLFGGNKLVLNTQRKMDAAALWQLCDEESINSLSIVGDAMARPLVDALADRDPPSSVVALVSGGAILSPAIKAEFGARMPNTMILDSFGASETGANGAVDMTASGPKFRMNEWTTVIGDDLEVVAIGETGMLARRGHVPLGYYKDETKTAATFVTGPDGTRWAIPGDRAVREADGTITVLGRGSQCINSGGEKIFPEEVESALKSHPAVFDATVVGRADERWGEHVCAVVQFRNGMSADVEGLATHCREHIAGYKVPRSVVVVDEMVRSPSGKPDYRWAKELAAQS